MPGTLSNSPSEVIRQLLIDLGEGSGTGDWPIFVDVQPDKPDSLITIIDTTGVHQGRKMINGEVQERHGFQILVRSAQFNPGWVKTRELSVALDQDIYDAGVMVGTNSYVVHSVSRSSGPISLGYEPPVESGNIPSTKRRQFSGNFTVSVRMCASS